MEKTMNPHKFMCSRVNTRNPLDTHVGIERKAMPTFQLFGWSVWSVEYGELTGMWSGKFHVQNLRKPEVGKW